MTSSKTDPEAFEVEPTSFKGCPNCDEGWVMVDGVAKSCDCRSKVLSSHLRKHSGIPPQYRHLSTKNLLDQKDLQPLSNSTRRAIEYAQQYVATYSPVDTVHGLLLIGPLAIGSCIAAAILNDLIQEHTVSCRYFPWQKLMTAYGRAKKEDDLEKEKLIYSYIDVPQVVALNEIGAARPSEEAWDHINTLFNTRYSKELPTIATTTYWNYRSTGLDPKGIDYAGRRAKRVTLGDQIGERARSRIADGSKILTFNQVDPFPLVDIFVLCEATSAEKGWTLPLLVERAPRYVRSVVEVRFDDFDNVYLCCDDHSRPMTNRDLYLRIKSYLDKRGIAFKPENAAYVQPSGVSPTQCERFLPVTGAFISDAGMSGDRTLTLSPFSKEIPDLLSRP